jgi:hypothetical protein
MQDSLGEFNDLCIQIDKLTNYVRQIRIKTETTRNVFISIGGLIAIKAQRKMKVREEFFNLYTEFRKPKNIQRYFDVFGES